MDFWKKTIRGFGHCSIFGIGLLGLHIVHKRQLSDDFKIVSYAATCAGLYMLTAYLLEKKDEGDDDDETKKEKPSLEEREKKLLEELEEDSTKTCKQLNEDDQPESYENLTSFQRILKDSSSNCDFKKLTDEFVELMKNYNELSDFDKEYVAQINPIFMKFRKLDIKYIKSFECESAKKAYLEEIGQELKRLRCETVMKGVTDDTVYYSDDSEDEDDSLEKSKYENCSSNAESEPKG